VSQIYPTLSFAVTIIPVTLL